MDKIKDSIKRVLEESRYRVVFEPYMEELDRNVLSQVNEEDAIHLSDALWALEAVSRQAYESVEYDPVGMFVKSAIDVDLSPKVLPIYLLWLHRFVGALMAIDE